jgi:hypothetical protein
MKNYLLSLAVVVVLTCVAAYGDVAVVAVGGEQSPDGNGQFFDFDIPSMNRSGQVAFVATLNGTTGGSNDNTGIFRGTGASGSLSLIVRRGNPSPDGNGNFALLDTDSDCVVNDAGQVAFIAGLSGTFGGGSDSTGIFRGDGTPGGLAQVVRSGQALPGGGTVPNLRGGGLLSAFAFNNIDEVAFDATGVGIFRSSGGSITAIARSFQSIPDGNGTFALLSVPALNDTGQVAFADGLSGIFRGDGATMLVQVARAGDPAPDGNGSFAATFSDPAVNNMGDVAFFASLAGTSGSTSDNQGIFIRKGDALMTIVRRGQDAPDGNGRFLNLNTPDDVAINEAGQVAFLATLTGTASGSTDNTGLFRGDGTTLTQIVRTGDRAPDGSVINNLSLPALNDAGQVAFLGGLVATGGGFTPHAIFLYDDQLGLLQAVRTGDSLLGSRIAVNSDLVFQPSVTYDGKRRSGLNEQSQEVFRFDLDDGRRGIAVANPFATPATASPTPSPTPTPTDTPQPPITPRPTRPPAVCAGDCDGNGTVAINELIQLVTFALGTNTDCSMCPNGIPAGVPCPSGVTVSVIIQGVNAALNGCSIGK